MSIELLTLLMFGSFFALLALGVHLAWGMAFVGLFFGFILGGSSTIFIAVFRVWGVVSSISLVAIPLFMFMAQVLQHSGIADDLFDAFHLWLGPVRGGLAMTAIGVCAIMGAMLGSAGAGVIIMGLVALPAMLRYKYDKSLALGTIMAGGGLGVLIPPSVLFIFYGHLAGESVGKLFMGGVGPGLLLAALFIIYIGIRCYRNPKMGSSLSEQERTISFKQKLFLLRYLVMPIFLILAVMGSIFIGMCTPTEAAGVGVLGAMVCAAVRGRFTWENLKNALFGTIKVVGLMYWIVFGATIFVGVYTLAGGGEFIKNLLLGLTLNRWGILIIIQLILLLLGMVMELIGICFLTVPIFVPIIVALGFDPLWFGVLFNVNLQIAFLSPPFGASMFYLKGVAPPEITMGDIYRSVWPFMGIQLIGLIACMLFPPIITWLPSMMIK